MANVLVVDDEPGLLQLIVMVLKQHGHTVLSASNGVEGLMVYSSYHGNIDLVLTDVQMPGMNGIEMAERVRAINPGARILLMSGFVPDNLAVPGEFQLIRKPFMPKQLVEYVAQALAAVP
jgi:CheY-like chemotaxis protein